jgi:hypothetical protein
MPEIEDEGGQKIQDEAGEDIVDEGGPTLKVFQSECVGSSGQLS